MRRIKILEGRLVLQEKNSITLANICIAFSFRDVYAGANEYTGQCIDAAGNNIAIHYYDMMVRHVKTCDKVRERLIELFKNGKLPKSKDYLINQ